MKKILLAFDGIHFSEGAFEFAKSLNERKRILLAGAFLPQVDYANFWSYSGGALDSPAFIPLPEKDNSAIVEKNIALFVDLCNKNFIDHVVHKDFIDLALPALVKETRFADLLIIGSELFYEHMGAGTPNEFLETALHAVECPVIVVPEKFEFPETTILSYDGSESAVYAIKQFAYLFPELIANKAIIVFAKKDAEKELPDEANIAELVNRHFPSSVLFRLEADARTHFDSWLMNNKNPLLVSGSFGRSGLSRLFHKSFVSGIIKDHKIPVFIAHHK